MQDGRRIPVAGLLRGLRRSFGGGHLPHLGAPGWSVWPLYVSSRAFAGCHPGAAVLFVGGGARGPASSGCP